MKLAFLQPPPSSPSAFEPASPTANGASELRGFSRRLLLRQPHLLPVAPSGTLLPPSPDALDKSLPPQRRPACCSAARALSGALPALPRAQPKGRSPVSGGRGREKSGRQEAGASLDEGVGASRMRVAAPASDVASLGLRQLPEDAGHGLLELFDNLM
eukprot:478519-Hanusia_phi.AAC.4